MSLLLTLFTATYAQQCQGPYGMQPFVHCSNYPYAVIAAYDYVTNEQLADPEDCLKVCLNLMQGLNVNPQQDFCCQSTTYTKLMDQDGNFYNGNQMSCTLSDASLRWHADDNAQGKPTYSAMLIPYNPVPTLEELCPAVTTGPADSATSLSKFAAVAVAAAAVSMTIY